LGEEACLPVGLCHGDFQLAKPADASQHGSMISYRF